MLPERWIVEADFYLVTRLQDMHPSQDVVLYHLISSMF